MLKWLHALSVYHISVRLHPAVMGGGGWGGFDGSADVRLGNWLDIDPVYGW